MSSKKETELERKRQPYHRWFRLVAAVAACFVIILGVIIYPSLMNLNRNNQQILDPNPIVDTKEIDTLKKAVPFELRVPETLPTGCKIDRTSVISGKLAQIIYKMESIK